MLFVDTQKAVMKLLKTYSLLLSSLFLVVLTTASQMAQAKGKVSYHQVEWPDLIPEKELQALLNPPESLNDVPDGDVADQISNTLAAVMNPKGPQNDYERALISTNVREEFNHRLIRIPGFIVPIEFDDEQKVTEMFLVPFFGACLHMPPPPPNQIIYATSKEGIKLETLMDAFWLEGKMSTALVKNDMATAAYSMRIDSVEPYYED